MTDARTDVYAAGATFYYLLSGHAPAPAPDRQSGAAGLAPVSKLAAKTLQATEKVVTQALELEPSARWSNAAEMQRLTVAASRKLTSAAAASVAVAAPAAGFSRQASHQQCPGCCCATAPPRWVGGTAGATGGRAVGCRSLFVVEQHAPNADRACGSGCTAAQPGDHSNNTRGYSHSAAIFSG